MLTSKCSFVTRFLLLPAVLLVTLSAVSFAQPQLAPAPRGTARFDQWLSQEVNHQLLMLPWYSVYDNIQYKIKGGTVTLQGQVVQDTTKSEAEKRVRGIEGVTKVNNNIEILPASPNDDRIRRAEYQAIFGDPALQVYSLGSVQPVHIIVKGGHVTLEGSVLNQGHKNLVGIRANGVSGVFSVTNNLRIENSKTQG
jgi:hyperosmotically inducible periplasmic protein